MATLQEQDPGIGRHQRRHARKFSANIDMTPMVDLAFLLLTFFILTTTFLKAHWMDIAMPDKGPPQAVPATQSLTLLLTGTDQVLWYLGTDDLASKEPSGIASLSKQGPDPIHKIILERNKHVLSKIRAVKDSIVTRLITGTEQEIRDHLVAVKSGDKNGLVVLIKADDRIKYKSLVRILDEMLLCEVAHYALADLSPNDKDRISEAEKAGKF